MERLSALVAQDVATATKALSVTVTVIEAPRGGISIEATATVSRAAPHTPRSRRADRNGHATSTDGLRPFVPVRSGET
jgi:NADPH-dependent 7-cyano-7-deazaguanine reductase QueF